MKSPNQRAGWGFESLQRQGEARYIQGANQEYAVNHIYIPAYVKSPARDAVEFDIPPGDESQETRHSKYRNPGNADHLRPGPRHSCSCRQSMEWLGLGDYEYLLPGYGSGQGYG